MKFGIAVALAIAAASPFIAAWPFMRWVWGEIRDPLFNAVKGEICYLFHYDHNIHKVGVEAEKLGCIKEKVDTLFQRIGDVAEDGVQTWLADVHVITAWVNELMEDKAKVDEGCLGRWCRYQLSKKANQKTDEITALYEKGSKFNILSRPAPPPKTRASVTAQIIDALKDDNTDSIGICGMGGVGKTTLVKEIGRRVKQTELFSEVVMAVVSKTPIVTKIQKEIAYMLGHELDDTVSESTRAWLLWQTIKARKKPVRVILDNVWGKLDLEAVGIPFGNDHKG
ncbi:disease resistance protein UNI-like [Cornus florida]|uniref:disease resistance protein UNI-like n=1 Tax=Cornus florida TaxID=4283 RepID=UPI0028A0EAD3|nr:disease resistance protein UNI-like [Cornus florida]